MTQLSLAARFLKSFTPAELADLLAQATRELAHVKDRNKALEVENFWLDAEVDRVRRDRAEALKRADEIIAKLATEAARWREAVRLHLVPKYVDNRDKPDDSWTVEEFLDGVIAGTIKP